MNPVAGVLGMPAKQFLVWNIIGAVLWVGTWAGLGFVAGTHMAVIYAEFERYRWYAIGVLVLTSVFRGVRRRLHGDSNPVSEEADPPGSVVTGTSDTRYPTEAPDDLADARRWADDA